ncbi:hypothetical protein ADIS_3686 [Lunatimonas lonarensis]|uniref:Uncharacterized protein n=1 Tax=Lunatimonas lonarensis TaxID=1232681 RepID=R7ZNW0_9BACT|nr:hypothetical protein ADIS_3686 [Lunatimonas lonarensis]
MPDIGHTDSPGSVIIRCIKTARGKKIANFFRLGNKFNDLIGCSGLFFYLVNMFFIGLIFCS